ncbi:MAG: twin transmembrane helix small protein [Acidobacteria bacterium]|nr:twin transmembrane helix small protein [Acidobacteriota bacterium]
MQNLLTIAFYLALAGIVVVLGFGLFNLIRTDENQASRSNKLMRLRVIFQAVAIGLIVLIGFAAGAIKIGG